MSSECLFNRLVKFHKMNVQIHSYRYCRVWNKKELGQMGLLKTPIVFLTRVVQLLQEGKEAHEWMEDAQSSSCVLCRKPFTVLRRRQ